MVYLRIGLVDSSSSAWVGATTTSILHYSLFLTERHYSGRRTARMSRADLRGLECDVNADERQCGELMTLNSHEAINTIEIH